MTAINGKAAVVTGGGSGIGMGLAKELARQGAAWRWPTSFWPMRRRSPIGSMPAAARRSRSNATSATGHRSTRMRDAATAALGPIQLVFANAGATSFDPLMEMSDEDVDWILTVNLHGVMNTTRAFLPGMIAAGGGHICATASMAGPAAGLDPGACALFGGQGGDHRHDDERRARIEAAQYPHHLLLPWRRRQRHESQQRHLSPGQFGGPGEGEVHVGEVNHEQTSLAFFHPGSCRADGARRSAEQPRLRLRPSRTARSVPRDLCLRWSRNVMTRRRPGSGIMGGPRPIHMGQSW